MLLLVSYVSTFAYSLAVVLSCGVLVNEHSMHTTYIPSLNTHDVEKKDNRSVFVAHERVSKKCIHAPVYTRYCQIYGIDELRTHEPTYTATRARALCRENCPVREIQ